MSNGSVNPRLLRRASPAILRLMHRRLFLILTLLPLSARAAEPLDVTQPTLITLKLTDVTQKNAFDEIAKSANLQFQTLPRDLWEKSPGSPISVSAEKQPFWLVMKDACAKAGISLKYATDTPRPQILLSRDNQDWTTYPTVATGPFLVSLIGLHRSTTVDMRKPADLQRNFYAKFTVFCEPRFRLLRGSLSAKIDEAVDDKGNSLVPKDAPEQPLNFVTSWVYNMEGKLEYPKTPGTKIAKLRASAKFVAQTASETIEYADPLTSKNVTKTVGGRKIIVKEVRRAAEEYEATVTFVRGDTPQAEWEQTVFPGNALRLVDGDNKTLVARGFGMGGKGDESTFVFKFEKEPPRGSRIGKPLKLAWEIPTQTKEIPLTFEFTDLPLP
jgi:hypothetical protein